jgi:hypothetical protein
VQRLQLPPSLYKCLGTTNVIESPQSGVQKRTHNVTRWRDALAVFGVEFEVKAAPLIGARLEGAMGLDI